MFDSIRLISDLDHYLKQKHYPLVNSVLLMQHGKIQVERYYNGFTPQTGNPIKSVWKSILSVCTGICIDKGMIKSVDDPISRYLPAFAERRHPYHGRITIKHLLTMTSGLYWNGRIHYHCPMVEQMKNEKDWISYLADVRMAYRPGTHYQYKEWDVILLSAVLGYATNGTSYDFCKKYLYEPLGIKSGEWALGCQHTSYNIALNEPEREQDSDLCARDMAKIGQLFLNKGTYRGKRIVSSDYVTEAVSPGKCNRGYGYMWWIFEREYGCRGFGGQEITVCPEEDVVYVVQATPTSRPKSYPDVYGFLMERI